MWGYVSPPAPGQGLGCSRTHSGHSQFTRAQERGISSHLSLLPDSVSLRSLGLQGRGRVDKAGSPIPGLPRAGMAPSRGGALETHTTQSQRSGQSPIDVVRVGRQPERRVPKKGTYVARHDPGPLW